MYTLTRLLVPIFIFFLSCSDYKPEIPSWINEYVASIDYQLLGGETPDVHYSVLSEHVVKVSVSFNLKDSIYQDDWQVNIIPAFLPDFHWASHLTPTDEHIIAQHAFRAPAVIVVSDEKKLTIIPDLNLLQEIPSVNWYMDMDAADNKITLGMSKSKVREHVLFVRDSGAVFPPGKREFGFYILVSDKKESIQNPFRDAVAFLWEKWGNNAFRSMVSGFVDLERYVVHTYNWAFDAWKESVWQEFNLNGKEVGAPVFIVNTTQSPNYPDEVNEREFRSIWNQAWFNSLRSASGLYRYAKRTENKKLLEYANKTKELALAFPQKNGFFPGLISTEMEKVEINEKKYNRSKGWGTYYFGNSNRNPYSRNARVSPYHILDMSFTANQMLLWYSELEQDKRLLDYAVRYADALIEIQFENGFFPGWLDQETLHPMQHLNESPESAMSVTFLLNLYKITQNEKYRRSALKAMNTIIENILYEGQWEDFETYWSCSRYGSEDLVGKKAERNNQYKQNTLSMFWAAEALLESFYLTDNREYLNQGERTLDELLMYQASWQPPYIYVRTVGGFAVMNADGEWNDSRQSLFSELIIRYGEELKRDEYIERGIAALYASFEMMYCPENNDTKKQWEKVWPFFNEKDYGFMMENYGHGGVTSPDGIGIGEFTIYDWGNGAASEAYNRIVDHFGKKFLPSGINKTDKSSP
ncbi:hypothetical protein D1164_10040 [Mariniphaga sediminis]|uniref:Uncharacterized protein n=1 Tax=Mariniphaga sediminis TaxID=1628158 RepID=A0A399D1W6_9BACT|nr:hypothetical protein [Mariniphaga sediminis]RIH65453.1 hypothetical protein D1164_10040 [Mariniphaga sediminis]